MSVIVMLAIYAGIGVLIALPATSMLYDVIEGAVIGNHSHQSIMSWLYFWTALIALLWPISMIYVAAMLVAKRSTKQHRLFLKEKQLELTEKQRRADHAAYLKAKEELDLFMMPSQEREEINKLKTRERDYIQQIDKLKAQLELAQSRYRYRA